MHAFFRRSCSQTKPISRTSRTKYSSSRPIPLRKPSFVPLATSLAVGSTLVYLYTTQTSSAESKSAHALPPSSPSPNTDFPLPRDKLRQPTDPTKEPIVLIALGSFSPITLMHLRLLEMSRDYFFDSGYEVLGGYFSPVSDAYGKGGLVSAKHRIKMVQLAVESSDWIMVDEWEARRPQWERTVLVLEHIREELNKNVTGKPIRVVFVCGSDLLESFNRPGVWDKQDIIDICTKFGLAVLSREGNNPESIIWSNDLLYSLKQNIHLIHQWIPNDISSTRVRLALSRGLSVKCLVPDPTLEYIKSNNLYANEKSPR